LAIPAEKVTDCAVIGDQMAEINLAFHLRRPPSGIADLSEGLNLRRCTPTPYPSGVPTISFRN